MPRANRILRHHRFERSFGYPAARVRGTVTKVFPAPEHHHGANHQHFRVRIDEVLQFDGADIDITGQTVFVAVRFGDSLGLDAEIEDLKEQTPIELLGEYIDEAHAYATEDNKNPVLPVLHFTHHPFGYVLYGGVFYS